LIALKPRLSRIYFRIVQSYSMGDSNRQNEKINKYKLTEIRFMTIIISMPGLVGISI